MNNARETMIIALDDLSREQAIATVQNTLDYAATFKIGLALFCAYGPSLVEEIQAHGADVFLDLKFHDIPMQVLKAVERCLKLNPRFLTLHTQGGFSMMAECARIAKGSQTTLLGVTILTSIDESEANRLGFNESIQAKVNRLATHAIEAGLSGLVCSPHEATWLKTHFGERALLVCPGVRNSTEATNDQARFMSAREAILAGADHLVIGRPITAASDCGVKAKDCMSEIRDALIEKEATHAL